MGGNSPICRRTLRLARASRCAPRLRFVVLPRAALGILVPLGREIFQLRCASSPWLLFQGIQDQVGLELEQTMTFWRYAPPRVRASATCGAGWPGRPTEEDLAEIFAAADDAEKGAALGAANAAGAGGGSGSGPQYAPKDSVAAFSATRSAAVAASRVSSCVPLGRGVGLAPAGPPVVAAGAEVAGPDP